MRSTQENKIQGFQYLKSYAEINRLLNDFFKTRRNTVSITSILRDKVNFCIIDEDEAIDCVIENEFEITDKSGNVFVSMTAGLRDYFTRLYRQDYVEKLRTFLQCKYVEDEIEKYQDLAEELNAPKTKHKPDQEDE